MKVGQTRIYENRHLILALSAFFFLMGCGTSEVNRQAVKEEMAKREVKRITPTQMQEKGLEMGLLLVKDLNASWQQELFDKMDELGESGALAYCKLDSGENFEFVRVSNKPRNQTHLSDSLEDIILGAYEYSHQNGQNISPSLHDVDPEYVLFNAPIIVENSKCLNCHGSVGGEISEELYDEIVSLYPSDSSINFQLNSLMGMWSIRIPKKQIVQEL